MSAPPGYLSRFAQLSHALELRREGRSYYEIANVVGLKDEAAAQRLISRAVRTVLRETAEEVRSIELNRLEILIKTLWTDAIADVKKDDYRKFDRVKGLIESKLKWCGAATSLEDKESGGVTIVINKFTNAAPNQPPAPKQIPSLEQIELQTAGNKEFEEAELGQD